MRAKTVLLFLAFMIGLAGADIAAQQKSSMEWMAGRWQIKTPGGIILEEWKITDDSTLSGRSVFVRNNTDTSIQETITLSFRNGQWQYAATVANQNGAKPVPFKVVFIKSSEFIAENPEHDFPQRIAYRRIQSQLFASIEGRKNGRFNKQNFDYVRVD